MEAWWADVIVLARGPVPGGVVVRTVVCPQLDDEHGAEHDALGAALGARWGGGGRDGGEQRMLAATGRTTHSVCEPALVTVIYASLPMFWCSQLTVS